MHAIPPFDVATDTTTAEAERVAASAAQVAAGGRPLLRMEAPSLSFEGSGEAFVYLTGKRLVMVSLSVLGDATSTVTTDVAQKVADWRTGVIFADRAALTATAKALSDSPGARRKARVIAYLSRLPLNGQYAVLTDALALRFVAPAPAASIEGWRGFFHVERIGFTESLLRLATEAAGGETTVIPDAISRLRTSGKSIAFHLFKGPYEQVKAFRSVTRHADLWAALLHSDQITGQAYLRSGDTVVAEPVRMLGGIVEARVSTPFKLRPGSGVLVWRDGDRGLPATLVDLGFDAESEMLTARFSKPASGKRRRNGYDVLFDGLGARGKGNGEALYVTTQPFSGTEAPGGVGNRSTSWTAGRSITRELPLFVSLAAAASPQGKHSGGLHERRP